LQSHGAGIENNTKEGKRQRKKGKKNIEYRTRNVEFRSEVRENVEYPTRNDEYRRERLNPSSPFRMKRIRGLVDWSSTN
jgi:hypothetical protein